MPRRHLTPTPTVHGLGRLNVFSKPAPFPRVACGVRHELELAIHSRGAGGWVLRATNPRRPLTLLLALFPSTAPGDVRCAVSWWHLYILPRGTWGNRSKVNRDRTSKRRRCVSPCFRHTAEYIRCLLSSNLSLTDHLFYIPPVASKLPKYVMLFSITAHSIRPPPEPQPCFRDATLLVYIRVCHSTTVSLAHRNCRTQDRGGALLDFGSANLHTCDRRPLM